jgi:hypothetical protein
MWWIFAQPILYILLSCTREVNRCCIYTWAYLLVWCQEWRADTPAPGRWTGAVFIPELVWESGARSGELALLHQGGEQVLYLSLSESLVPGVESWHSCTREVNRCCTWPYRESLVPGVESWHSCTSEVNRCCTWAYRESLVPGVESWHSCTREVNRWCIYTWACLLVWCQEWRADTPAPGRWTGAVFIPEFIWKSGARSGELALFHQGGEQVLYL